MKVCPKCQETYKDDELNFCLSDGTTLVKKSLAAKPHSRINEVVAVILLAIAVLAFLCLITYSPSDWSLNTASAQRTQNWIGVAGAVVADIMFQAIGLSAYVFPAVLAAIAWRIFHSVRLRPRLSRIIGSVLLLVSVSSLVHMFGWHGGVVGAFFYKYTANLIGNIGTGILLSAVFLVSVILATNLTFRGFFSRFDLEWQNVRQRINDWRVRRGHSPETESIKAKERSEKRREIRTGKTGELPPTISIGDVRAKKRNPDEEAPRGTIAVGDGPNATTATAAASPTILTSTPNVGKVGSDTVPPESVLGYGSIPIAPIKHTGDLTGELESVETGEIAEPTEPKKPKDYQNYALPPTKFLTPSPPQIEQKDEELLAIAVELAEKTKEFNVTGRVVNISKGPVVTTYEFKPDPGVKYSRVTSLVDDLCLALQAESIRIDRIPGKAFVGIEVPNNKRETIHLREVVESKKFRESHSLLTIALGKTIDGLNYVTDLAKMPHLLIAGATGAGKSVGVNSLVVSILYKAKPDEVKFIMVDPKRLELGLYADIPHLATPIITDPKRAATSLRWAVSEMERRYKELAGWGVRNIVGYNDAVKRRNSDGHLNDDGGPWATLPYIVIIIDELADLMMVSGKEVEESITRLAQMARAVGIHLVLATQRPSVDVITGLIKANFPSRISFRVSSKVDSRTIIDSNGAESLLGRGDMLFLPPGNSQLIRVHGAYVDEKEIGQIVDHIKKQGLPDYDTNITKSEDESDDGSELPGRKDPLFWDAVRSVVLAKRASTSLLQRHLRIGYGRAAAILDAMVRDGYIGEMDGSTRARPVLPKAYEDIQDVEEMESA
ncbi:MAG: DNA translocase FtsK 4TM domain-containing protein [Pyrinomonadaceae bacterium]